MIQNILVCGDGDLSFSADIAAELDSLGIQLFATVLEDEETHNKVYEFSASNTNKIKSFGHKAMFGVDATQLSAYFGNKSLDYPLLFDRIQFNFPHWRGKANNRYNSTTQQTQCSKENYWTNFSKALHQSYQPTEKYTLLFVEAKAEFLQQHCKNGKAAGLPLYMAEIMGYC
eukprot:scaffold45691_cov74-Cyclotella_meneghiniana.AAC.5